MSLLAAIKRIEAPASTGNVDYTGLSFQPKLIIIFTEVNSVNDGTIQVYTRQAIGAASSATRRWAAGTAQDDANGSSNTRRSFVSNKCINTTNGSGTLEFVADLVSFLSDGFRLNWTLSVASGYEFYALCLGGDDFEAQVGTFDIASGTGLQSVTGLDFQPEALMLAFTKDDTTEGEEAHCSFIFGMADGVRQNVTEMYDPDAAGTMNTDRIQNNDDILRLTHDGVSSIDCEFASFLSDGFRINRTTTSITPRVGFIAMRGVSARADQFSGATSTGVQSISGVGFAPKVVIIHSVGTTDESENDHAIYAFGYGLSGTERVSFGCQSSNGYADSNCEKITDENNLLTFLAPSGGTSVKTAVGDLDSLNADGFSVDWTTVDSNARIVSYMALGDAPVAGGQPIYSRRKDQKFLRQSPALLAV